RSGQTEAQEDAKKKDDTPTCTLETLKGRYLFGGIVTLLPPAVTQPTLASDAFSIFFNGDGTGAVIVTSRVNGITVLENLVAPFSYTVNANCTGAYTVPNGPSFGLFIAPTGEELVIIPTDPGHVGVFDPAPHQISREDDIADGSF